MLNTLKPGDYHITVISPETYTTFTPLLPCKFTEQREECTPTELSVAAAVGTVQVRSLVEPLRKIVARLRGHVLTAKVMQILRRAWARERLAEYLFLAGC